MKLSKILALMLALVMVLAIFAGCGNKADEPSEPAEPSTPAEPSEPTEPTEPAEPSEPAESGAWTDDPFMSRFDDPGMGVYSLPLSEEPVTFTYFSSFNPQMADLIDEVGKTDVDQWYNQVTNVYFEYHAFHPSAQVEQFNLMITSGDWCDTFTRAGGLYAGGYAAMIEDEIIWDLADMIEQYAPNYSAIITEDKDLRSSCILPSGGIPAFANLFEEPTGIGYGMMIRQDWVNELGMETPETIDEYYEYIKACNAKYGATMWLAANGMFINYEFASAYGIALEALTGMSNELASFMVDGEVVSCGLLEKDGFLSYVNLMHDWYAEGLIFQDFMSGDLSNSYCNNSANNVDRLYNNEFCVWESMTENFVDYQDKFGAGVVSAAAAPVLNKGDQVDVGYYYCRMNSWANSIAATCSAEKAAILVQWLDLHYSELGSFIGLFGVEGVTFEFDANGEPHFNDLVMNNPDGLATRQVTAIHGGGGGMYYDLADLYAETYPEDGLVAESIWRSNYTQSRTYPNLVVQFTTDESEVHAAYLGQVLTYITETVTRSIIGDIDINEYYDEFVDTLNVLGLQEIIETYQNAYDRYLAA